MSSPIAPYVAQLVTSPGLRQLKRKRAERRRIRKKQPHLVTVYLRINDAYSYVLLQLLQSLASRYPLEYDFRTVLNLQADMYPAPELWQKNAFSDGAYLAALYQLPYPGEPPSSSRQRDAMMTAQLLHWELQPGYLDNALALFHAYWQSDSAKLESLVDPAIAGHVECYQHHLQANENLLKSNGHYLSAMLHYGGEWYWGLDRLEHLERRLNAMDLGQTSTTTLAFDRGYRDFCKQAGKQQQAQAPATDAANTAIVLYWSIRSPYSYIGLVRARQLAEHYQLALVVKPVLPMVMRRMQVPRSKRLYILRDAKREAEKHGIDFGSIADPLGKGVERCYALYDFALSSGKGVEFLESYARGVWAEGIRSDTDQGLLQLVQRAGLDWQQARHLVDDDSWRLWAQQNLADMYARDVWGVPSFVYGDTTVFGQDRVDCIERAILADRVAE